MPILFNQDCCPYRRNLARDVERKARAPLDRPAITFVSSDFFTDLYL